MTIRSLLILIAICFSTTELAAGSAGQSLETSGWLGKAQRADSLQTRGAVRGTKLWAVDCVGVELLQGPDGNARASDPARSEGVKVAPVGQALRQDSHGAADLGPTRRGPFGLAASNSVARIRAGDGADHPAWRSRCDFAFSLSISAMARRR